MRVVHGVLFALCLLARVDDVRGGRVKQALFGLFGSSRRSASKSAGAHEGEHDADQLEMIDFLKTNGFGQYAGREFIEKLDEVLAYDSIEDLTHIVADDDYTEINMPRGDAELIQKLARREMLRRFLVSVPLPAGAASDVFTTHLDALMKAGYDEAEDVADLEEDEAAKTFGIKGELFKVLTTYAEEYEARELLHVILTTLVDAKTGAMPYTSEATWRPIVEALVKAGVRNLEDVATITSAQTPELNPEDLQRIQHDARVLQHMPKQEL